MKKILIGLGPLGVAISPLIMVVSCGESGTDTRSGHNYFYLPGYYTGGDDLEPFNGRTLESVSDSLERSDDWYDITSEYKIDGLSFESSSQLKAYLENKASTLYSPVIVPDNVDFSWGIEKTNDFDIVEDVKVVYLASDGGYTIDRDVALEGYIKSDESGWYEDYGNLSVDQTPYKTREELEEAMYSSQISLVQIQREGYVSSESITSDIYEVQSIRLSSELVAKAVINFSKISYEYVIESSFDKTYHADTKDEVLKMFFEDTPVTSKVIESSNPDHGDDFTMVSTITGTIPTYSFTGWNHFESGWSISEFIFGSLIDAREYYSEVRSVDVLQKQVYKSKLPGSSSASTINDLIDKTLESVKSFSYPKPIWWNDEHDGKYTKEHPFHYDHDYD